jgi:hypothetical protein
VSIRSSFGSFRPTPARIFFVPVVFLAGEQARRVLAELAYSINGDFNTSFLCLQQCVRYYRVLVIVRIRIQACRPACGILLPDAAQVLKLARRIDCLHHDLILFELSLANFHIGVLGGLKIVRVQLVYIETSLFPPSTPQSQLAFVACLLWRYRQRSW